MDLFRVGVITDTHGLKGELKVFPTTEDPARFLDLTDVLLGDDEREDTLINVTVSGVRFFKNLVIIKLKGYDHINEVEGFKKQGLFVTRENAIPLEEGEYYVKDLIGLDVVTEEGESLGSLIDVLETGANDVYVVRKPGRKDILIPVIEECILEVSLEGGIMKVHLLPGLRDL